MSEVARVTAQEAVEWAKTNKVVLPEKNRLSAINAERLAHDLPPFSIIPERIGDNSARKPNPPPPPPPAQPTPVDPRSPAMSEPIGQEIIHPPLQRQNVSDLRDILFQELTALRSGKSDPPQAQAVAKLAAQIVSTYRLEISGAYSPLIGPGNQRQISPQE